jgi:cell division protein FtsW (lipid II flippase)
MWIFLLVIIFFILALIKDFGSTLVWLVITAIIAFIVGLIFDKGSELIVGGILTFIGDYCILKSGSSDSSRNKSRSREEMTNTFALSYAIRNRKNK